MILKNEDTIFTFLAANGVDYFIMGSTRFGYNTLRSDIDICVFISIEKARELLHLVNAVREEKSLNIHDYGILYTTVYRTNFFTKEVHLLICHNNAQYAQLEKEHEEIETFLKKNKVLTKYIIQIKQMDSTINGGVLYKALVLLKINQQVRKILQKEV
jgi:GTPase involved in cell partitioning and DNA repair